MSSPSSALLGPDKTFDRLARLTAKAVAGSGAFVSIADRGADGIVIAGLTGVPELASGQRLTLSETVCRHVVATGEPLAIEDANAYPECSLRELGLGAYLGVPLEDGSGTVVGALCAVDRSPRPWSAGQVEIAEGLATAVMTELDLRAAELRYRGLVENIPLVTYVSDLGTDSALRFISPQIVPLLGYSLEEWAANPDLTQEVVHPEDRERALALALSSRERKEPGRGEFRLVGKDGRIVSVVDHTVPLLDERGEIVSCQGFLLDVTESKRLEEQRRQSQKLEAIGQLAGGIAHDFNNMLTAINGYAELLGLSFEPDDPRVHDVVELKRATGHAAALTRQLLAFSRNQVLQPQRLDPNDVVRDLERLLRRTIGEQIVLETELAEGIGKVEADPDQLAQVVVNIALNARDAMPGGGRLSISTSNVVLPTGAHVEIEIADSGSGMDEETKRRIFEPFFTTKDVGKGTGLGLATAYGVVRQSGGSIELESGPGRGSTFRVLLPHASALGARAAA